MTWRGVIKPAIRSWGLLPGCWLHRRGRPDGAPERVLLIALHHLGDLLWTTPLMRAIRAGWPDTRLDLWIKRRGLPAIGAHPLLDRIHICDAVNADRTREPPTDWAEARAFVRTELLPKRYGVVLDLSSVLGSTLLGRWVSRRGFFVGRSGQGLDWLFDAPLPRRRAHRIALHLDALKPLGLRHRGARPEMFLTAEEAEWASDALALPLVAGELGRMGLRARRKNLLLVHPGAGWPEKTAPADWWVRLLAALGSLEPSLVAGPGEPYAGEIAARVGIPLIRPPSFGALGALLLGTERFLGCDSGPAHLAGLAGCETTLLFGPTDPRLVRPWGRRVRVLQAPGGRLERFEPSRLALRIASWDLGSSPTVDAASEA